MIRGEIVQWHTGQQDADDDAHDSVDLSTEEEEEYAPLIDSVETKKIRRYVSNVRREDTITITWNNVNVYAPEPKKRFCKRGDGDLELSRSTQILNEVSGYADSGSILGIIGTSGAGKSTLMNVLTSRNRGDLIIEGDIQINGRPFTSALTGLMAYVQQDDLFIPSLTVKEHLQFQALLRMDADIAKKSRMERVDDVLSQMGLLECSNHIIGDKAQTMGISGGQAKRLSVAAELLTNPPLMFLDEPTTGLDSFMAQTVVAHLAKLAEGGHTIIATIHQPSSEVYQLFDRLFVMADGRTVYHGPRPDAVSYFTSFGFECPTNFCPADFFINTLSDVNGNEAENKRQIKHFCDKYETSEYAINVKEFIDRQVFRIRPADDQQLGHVSEKKTTIYKAGWCSQLSAVLWRCLIVIRREPVALRVRLLNNMILSIVIGLIFLQLDYNQTSIQNITGCLFFVMAAVSNDSFFPVVQLVPKEWPIVLREHFNGMYRIDVYFIAKWMTELPICIVLPIIYTSVIYWMVGFNPMIERYFICLGIMLIVTNTGVSIGYLVSSISPSVTIATQLGSMLLIFFVLFGGFFLSIDMIPNYFIWLRYLSHYTFAFEALCINQWYGFEGLECNNATQLVDRCITSGDQVLELYSFVPDNFNINITSLFLLMIGYRLVAFIILLLRSRRHN